LFITKAALGLQGLRFVQSKEADKVNKAFRAWSVLETLERPADGVFARGGGGFSLRRLISGAFDQNGISRYNYRVSSHGNLP
jgi:hypothetical protein